MAKPADIEADLTLEISGSDVTPDRFQRATAAFFDLLGEVGKGVAAKGEPLEWRVQVKQGSNLVGVLPGPRLSQATAAGTRRVMVAGLEALQRAAEEPPGFSDRALLCLKRLIGTTPAHDEGDFKIAVWGQKVPVLISGPLADNVRELLNEAYTDQGSVEGHLRTVSEAGGFRIVLYEPLFGRPVRCDVPEHLMSNALTLFGKRVEVFGSISYRRDGEIARVRVEDLVPFPDDQQLPTHDQVRGILRANA